MIKILSTDKAFGLYDDDKLLATFDKKFDKPEYVLSQALKRAGDPEAEIVEEDATELPESLTGDSKGPKAKPAAKAPAAEK